MRRRLGFTLVELLVVIAIIGMLVALLLPAVSSARTSARAAQCRNNLRQLAVATLLYENNKRHFPPARIQPRPGQDNRQCGGNGVSWVVHTLPYIEEEAFADEWGIHDDFSDHADDVRMRPLDLLVCPERRSASDAVAMNQLNQSSPAPQFASADMGNPVAMCGWLPQPGPGPSPQPFPNPLPDPDRDTIFDEDTPLRLMSGALGDYAGNHRDLSPGAKGEVTDFYFGGNGTGVIISARPTCNGSKVVGWTDKIRAKDISDGLSKTFLIGERHVSRQQLRSLPNDGPIYCGSEVYFSSRIAGPGARLALGPDDQSASQYALGSWHSEICHFANVDGSVKSISVDTNTSVLANMGNREDGSAIQ